MWWLNEKVAVRVVAVIPGPHGSVLARARRGVLALPSVRLGRDASPEESIDGLVRMTCGIAVGTWVPRDAVRRPGSRLDAVFVAMSPKPIETGRLGRVAWVAPSMIRREDLARWMEADAS
jgi:hypothetical protein